jgi:hypothetical protein
MHGYVNNIIQLTSKLINGKINTERTIDENQSIFGATNNCGFGVFLSYTI